VGLATATLTMKDEILSYLQIWWGIIFKGFISSPWYICKFLFSGCQTKYLCLPWKKHCSMNGQNIKYKAYVPFGILELAAFLATFYAYSIHHWDLSMSVPVVYADVEQLTKPWDATKPGCGADDGPHHWACEHKPVRSHLTLPPYIGNWAEGIGKMALGDEQFQTSAYLGLDSYGLISMRDNCLKQYTNNSTAMHRGEPIFDKKAFKAAHESGYLKSWVEDIDHTDRIAAEFAASSDVDKAAEDSCNFLTISNGCYCVGFLPSSAATLGECPSDNSAMTKLMTTAKVDDKDTAEFSNNPNHFSGCRAMPGGAGQYIDLKNIAPQYHNRKKAFAFLAMLVAACRLGAYWFDLAGKYKEDLTVCQGDLKKPGSQWINGWWAGIACFASIRNCNQMKAFVDMNALHEQQKESDPAAFASEMTKINSFTTYFPADFVVFGYTHNKTWGKLYGFDYLNKPLLDKAILWLQIAAFLNIACSFFSDQAYCNDCTNYAYTMENIQRVRRREKRMEALKKRKGIKIHT